jgi:hypothetical protein
MSVKTIECNDYEDIAIKKICSIENLISPNLTSSFVSLPLSILSIFEEPLLKILPFSSFSGFLWIKKIPNVSFHRLIDLETTCLLCYYSKPHLYFIEALNGNQFYSFEIKSEIKDLIYLGKFVFVLTETHLERVSPLEFMHKKISEKVQFICSSDTTDKFYAIHDNTFGCFSVQGLFPSSKIKLFQPFSLL